MSISVVFGIIGAIKLAKNGNNAIRWLGLSAVMLGTQFVIYMVYNAVVGMLDFAILTEVGAVSFLGLGLSIIRHKI